MDVTTACTTGLKMPLFVLAVHHPLLLKRKILEVDLFVKHDRPLVTCRNLLTDRTYPGLETQTWVS